MRLSEALMLGSVSGEQPTNNTWDSCLLGVACHALGKRNHMNEAAERWPWLLESVSHPTVFTGCHLQGTTFVTLLCKEIEDGRMSVSRAAEIIREIEPAELEVGEVQNEQTDSRQGPIPKLSLEAREA